MKSTRLALALAATMALVAVAPAFAADSAKDAKSAPSESRVQVVFSHPENFTDVKDSVMATDRGRDAILDEFRSFIQRRALGDLPAADSFEITFTNIDLAGEYEPWRTPPADNIRVVKDIYPPRFAFSYKITNTKTGAVVRSGKENLTDLNFMSRLVINRSDDLYIEKDILGDWLDSHLSHPSAND